MHQYACPNSFAVVTIHAGNTDIGSGLSQQHADGSLALFAFSRL
jgi:hypothetical protein